MLLFFFLVFSLPCQLVLCFDVIIYYKFRIRHDAANKELSSIYQGIREFAANNPAIPSFGLRDRLPLDPVGLEEDDRLRHAEKARVWGAAAANPRELLDLTKIGTPEDTVAALDNAIASLQNAKRAVVQLSKDIRELQVRLYLILLMYTCNCMCVCLHVP